MKFVALDGLGEKEDLSDFLGKHRKIVEDLNALYEAAPDWTVTDADERKTDAISSDRVIENQLTELGSARLLNEKHGENLKHHSGLGYLVWDGRRWEPSMKAAYRLVHKLGDIIRETAKDTKDPTLVGKIYTHSKAIERSQGAKAILEQVQSLEGIDADAIEFDSHPLPLNCLNGVVDLRTGELLEHSRGLYITKLAPINYNPKAKAPRYMQTLEEVFLTDKEIVKYWQHIMGYALTGDTKLQYFYILYGSGSNGKTTLLIVGYVKSQNGKAPDTIGGDLTKLQRIFRHFVDREAIAANPFKHPSVKEVWPQSVKHERCFTDAEFSCFMEEARKPCRSPQTGDYADLFALLAESGLRLGEALHLRWCDIAFGHEEGSYLRVQPWGKWTPKTKKSVRNVPLSPAVEAMLRTRLRAKADVDPKACIFPLNWTLRSVNQHFNRVLKRACLHERDERDQKLRVDSFRHYYASVLVRSGADPATVRDLLGHDSIVTTNRYFNVPRSELFGVMAGAFSRTRFVHEPSGLYRF